VKSAPLVLVAPNVCHRDMKPGNVKRVTARGPLVGYYIACPCGWKATYLHDEVGFREEQAIPSAAYPKRLVGFDRPPTCLRCEAVLTIRDGQLEAS
jgi:hypothetical protein